jgi:hypothetical protein
MTPQTHIDKYKDSRSTLVANLYIEKKEVRRQSTNGGLTNREMGEGLITMGQGEGGRVGGEGHAVVGEEVHVVQWGKVGTLERWTLEEPGWLGTASGVRAANMAGVNSEGRAFMN